MHKAIYDLPATLLAEVLQHVPLKERLSACALVCRAFASAATLATTHLKELWLPLENVAAFESWAQQHAEQLVSLEIGPEDWRGGYTLQLPWERLTRLQVLDVGAMHLQLPGTDVDASPLHSEDEEAAEGTNQHPSAATNSSSSSEQLRAQEPLADMAGQHLSTSTINSSGGSTGPLLPVLQKLQFDNCGPLWPEGLLQLTQGCKLISLQISDDPDGLMECPLQPINRDVPKQQLHAALVELLQQQPGLTCLHLNHLNVGPAAVQHLSSMTRLQELVLELRADMDASCLERLPSCMTALSVYDRRPSNAAASLELRSLPVRLAQLTSLAKLTVVGGGLAPAVLAELTQLGQLDLAACALLPSTAGAQPADGATALLGALPRLQRLQHIRLSFLAPGLSEASPQHLSALTASSQLTHLELNVQGASLLPQGAAGQMFPAHRKLTQLKHLSLAGPDFAEQGLQAPRLEILAHDLSSIVSSCPGLATLSLQHVVNAKAGVAPLRLLTESCTKLIVSGSAFTNAAAADIAHLTQLRHLWWSDNDYFSDRGLQELTALTQLTRLVATGCLGVSRELLEGSWHDERAVALSSDDGQGPVWKQLDALLDKSCELAPPRLATLRIVHRRVQERHQQELAGQQLFNSLMINALQSQLAAAQAQVQSLQQQLAEVQSESRQ